MSSRPLVSNEEMETLITALREAPPGSAAHGAAQEAAYMASRTLVRNVVSKFAHRGESREDLEQVGDLGLLKAIDRYELGSPGGFVPYAIPTITGEIRHYFRDNTWAVKVSRTQKELAARYYVLVDQFYSDHGRSATAQELADLLGVDAHEMFDAVAAAEHQSARDIHSLADGGVDVAVTEDHSTDTDTVLFVEDLLNQLPETDRLIVKARFFEDKSQSEIAALAGVSQMQVSRVLRRAMDSMRSAVFADREAFAF